MYIWRREHLFDDETADKLFHVKHLLFSKSIGILFKDFKTLLLNLHKKKCLQTLGQP